MAVIMMNTKGLLEGKRVRKLSLKARLYYPLLLGLANTFARLELDYELLAARFISFHDPDTANIENWFLEYEKADLVFLYDGPDAGSKNATRWAQFDTPIEYRRSYPTKEDADSPAPPEPAYTDWLQSIHGAEWKAFHITEYQKKRQSDLTEKRAEAGRKGGAASGVSRRLKQNEAFASDASNGKQTNLDGNADVETDVDGEGEGEEGNHALLHNPAVRSNTLPSLTSHNGQDGKNKNKDKSMNPPESAPSSGAPLRIGSAEWFADHFHWLVVNHNPNCKPEKIVRNWREAWTKDFADLLGTFDDPQEVMELIAYSQTPKQAVYNVRPAMLIEHMQLLDEGVKRLKKKPEAWAVIWKPWVDIVNAIAPDTGSIEFNDEPAEITFNVEGDEDELG
jgi:general stress protein YciG